MVGLLYLPIFSTSPKEHVSSESPVQSSLGSTSDIHTPDFPPVPTSIIPVTHRRFHLTPHLHPRPAPTLPHLPRSLLVGPSLAKLSPHLARILAPWNPARFLPPRLSLDPSVPILSPFLPIGRTTLIDRLPFSSPDADVTQPVAGRFIQPAPPLGNSGSQSLAISAFLQSLNGRPPSQPLRQQQQQQQQLIMRSCTAPSLPASSRHGQPRALVVVVAFSVATPAPHRTAMHHR
ncbi:hypothetical protein PYCCODRAFT_767158 [Trametes coccinea BRFM310]|uniref:Uncharacterized protein n=1 Tax=Trametes coccinea (strain BRFM310) TaxID=1353009 RepID=A0A1Y2J086_TRAC3|nr:hypothetical protein PYCCODRAFT_767158 [Trametes coccinea BRFM310]